MFRYSVKFFLIFIPSILSSFFISAATLPAVFSFIEKITRTPLPYEGAVRLYIIFILFILMLGSLTWLGKNGRQKHWVIFFIIFIAFINLIVVFFLDTKHRLFEEFSWIRYGTAGFLFMAAATAIILARFYLKKKQHPLGLVWILFSLAFVFVGLDELFELHEALGKFIFTRTALGGKSTDYITLAYALLALIFIVGLVKIFKREYLHKRQLFLKILLAGGFIYFFSTILDTIDTFVGDRLRQMAIKLSTEQKFIFSDFWYLFWNPHNFLNALEEVFEQVAAVLFFIAFLVLFLEAYSINFKAVEESPKRNFILSFGSLAVLLLLALAASGSFYKNFLVSSPLVDSQIKIYNIAGPSDGLNHADDLFYDHELKTLFVANEGRGNIYTFTGSGWQELSDARVVKSSKNIDSLTIHKGQVFSAGDGITSDGTAIFMIDEKEKTLKKIFQNKEVASWKPEHLLWQAPEGIAYDQSRDSLIVTDDVTGAIFRVHFDKSVDLIARLSRAEDVVMLSGGSMLVSDNAWGAIFLILPDGTTKKIVQFRRPYRDLQGIAIDQNKNIYIVSADGYDSQSFIPSFLWKIDSTALFSH